MALKKESLLPPAGTRWKCHKTWGGGAGPGNKGGLLVRFMVRPDAGGGNQCLLNREKIGVPQWGKGLFSSVLK